MTTRLIQRSAALAAAALMTIGAGFAAPADASTAQLRTEQTVQVAVVQTRSDTLVLGTGGGGGHTTPGDLTTADGGRLESDKYCGNDKVDDDIVECDIGEIAYVCPDGKAPSSGECSNNMGPEFP